MIQEKDILKLETRRKIYEFIEENPGLNIREISRRLNIPFTSLSYHLKYLKKLDLIREKHEGNYKKIFIAYKVGTRDKQILSLLRNNNSCKILLYLIWNYSCSQIELSKELIIPPPTVSYHLKRMLDLGIIEEVTSVNGRIYPIPDHEKYLERKAIKSEKFYRRKNTKDSYSIYKLLICHKSSFNNQQIVNYCIDSWELYKTRRHLLKGNKLLILDDQIDSVADTFKSLFPPPFCA
jgi:DNA-binding transcriptional ArsR family regulator